jgi:hypothetical protein
VPLQEQGCRRSISSTRGPEADCNRPTRRSRAAQVPFPIPHSAGSTSISPATTSGEAKALARQIQATPHANPYLVCCILIFCRDPLGQKGDAANRTASPSFQHSETYNARRYMLWTLAEISCPPACQHCQSLRFGLALLAGSTLSRVAVANPQRCFLQMRRVWPSES